MTVRSTQMRGFTLIELLITVMLLAILLGVGVPNFVDFNRSQNVSARINALHQDATLARSEAVKRQVNAIVVASGATFAAGWEVCADTDGNGTCASPDVVISSQAATPENYTLKVADGTGAAITVFRFNRSGALQGANGVNATTCAPQWSAAKDLVYARNLRISAGGYAQTFKGKSTASGVNTCP